MSKKKEYENVAEMLEGVSDNSFLQIKRATLLALLQNADISSCYLMMAFAAGAEKECFFTEDTISKYLKISLPTARRFIKQLLALKLIGVIKNDHKKRNYKILTISFEESKDLSNLIMIKNDHNQVIKNDHSNRSNLITRHDQKRSQQVKENPLQQVEKKSEIDTLHQGLLDPILLDPILLDLKRIEKNRKECCEASASELSSASLADAFLIFENQIESLISQPLSRLFQDPFTIDLSNEELSRYRNTLPESLPILKSTINAYSIFALHEYFFPSEYYTKSLRAECLQAIEDFAALMLQRHKVRLTDKLFCRAIMLLTPGEYTEYGQNYWCQFLMNGHIFKIYDQKMGIYKKFYAAITSERTCTLSNKIIHEKIS